MRKESAETLIERFKKAKEQLLVLLGSEVGYSEEMFRKFDAQMSNAFEQLLQAEFDDHQELLKRIAFLASQIRESHLSDQPATRMASQIEVDIETLRGLQVSPILRVVEDGDDVIELETTLFELCYSSTAIQTMGKTQLDEIQTQSEANNKRTSITGMLTYDEGTKSFFQILEGPEDNIQAVMEKIIKDERHHSINIRFQSPIAGRIYSNWAMHAFTTSQIKETLPPNGSFREWLGQRLDISEEKRISRGHQWMVNSIAPLLD